MYQQRLPEIKIYIHVSTKVTRNKDIYTCINKGYQKKRYIYAYQQMLPETKIYIHVSTKVTRNKDIFTCINKGYQK
jgi:hypothetical protein